MTMGHSLCYQGECPIVIGGTLSYRDTDHITTEYAANLWALSLIHI